jgi:hypothetical protein
MGIFKIFGRGFRGSARKGRMLVYLWLVNILFSLIMVTPFYFLLQKDFSRSLAGEKLVQGLDLLSLGDIIFKYQGVSSLFVGWMLVPSLLFLFLQIFLNGGIIGRIAAGEEKINICNFFGDCGKYFWRFLRVFLISIIGYLVVFGLLGRILSAIYKAWIKNAATEWTVIIASLLRLLVLLLLFSLVKMFFDYAKIRLVAEQSKKAVRATVLNFSFLRGRFFKAWGLFLIVGLVFIVLSAIYLAIARVLPPTRLIPMVIVFLWQQAYVFARAWVGVLFFSTEYDFFKIHQAPSA